MYKGYKDKEKRRRWLKKWRRENNERCNEYLRNYLKRTGKSYYKKREKKDEYMGTSGIGRKYEKMALRLLKGSIDTKSFSGKWDIEWNGLKIDVKMRSKRPTNYYVFTTKKNPIADYYLLFLVDNKKIKKVLLIPKNIFKTSLSIKDTTKKYDKYALKF